MIFFQNPGLIPVEAITTLGVNVKEGESPIGYFGTGLKYAIAIIVRLGGEITIYRGLDAYHFASSKRVIRGKPFEIITMNGRDLGFTTELGKNWEPWQALREIYSNMLDEGGVHGRVPPRPAENQTLILIDCPAVEAAYERLDDIILLSASLITSNSVAIHPGPSQFIFYRGIRCVRSAPRPSPVTYNVLTEKRLTEDRTFANVHDIGLEISRTVMELQDEALAYKILTAGQDTLEWGLAYPVYWSASTPFKEALRDACRRQPDKVNPGAKYYLQSMLSVDERFEEATLSPWEEQLLAQSVTFIKQTGILSCTARIKVVRSLPGSHGAADRGTNTVILSQDLLSKGLVYVVGTLIEEYAHLEKNLAEGREICDFFLDRLVNLMMEKYGVPAADNSNGPYRSNDGGVTLSGGSS